jgi:hypothetical protein
MEGTYTYLKKGKEVIKYLPKIKNGGVVLNSILLFSFIYPFPSSSLFFALLRSSLHCFALLCTVSLFFALLCTFDSSLLFFALLCSSLLFFAIRSFPSVRIVSICIIGSVRIFVK